MTSGERALPPGVEALGVAGLLPFAAGVLGVVLLEGEPREFALRALVAYGAVILSFLGAVHWGLVLGDGAQLARVRLAAGVLPALAAWLALLLPVQPALATLVAAFGAFWLYEHRIVGTTLLPGAYLRLRRGLTLVVCSLLALGLIATG